MVINMWISQRMMREKRVAEPQAGPVSLVGEGYLYAQGVREDRKSTRLNSSHMA